MKASDYIAQFLKINGVDTVFGLTGAHILHVFDSLDKAGIRIIACNHEQGAAFAADAYARISGKVGVCVTTSGPGALNAVSGVASAYFDSVPVLFLTGQVVTGDIRSHSRAPRQLGFQETDIVSVFGPVIKGGRQARDVSDLPDTLRQAWMTATGGRCGPVLLDLPDDVQRGEVNECPTPMPESAIPLAEIFFPRPLLPEGDLRRLANLFIKARRPVIILGAGVRQAWAVEAVGALMKDLGWPVLTTWGGLDLMAADDPQLVGTFGACGPAVGNMVVQHADLVLSLGSRLWAHTIGGNPHGFAPNAVKVVVDIDQNEFDKFKGTFITNGQNKLWMLNADLNAFCHWIYNQTPGKPLPDWCAQIAEWKAQCPFDASLPPYDFLANLTSQTPADAIVVTDAGATLCQVMQSWRVKAGQRVVSSFNHSPMGWAVPAALGASLAAPGRRVICVTGDGSFNMNAQELAVIAGLDLPVTVVVLDNGGYGIIRQTQDTWLEGRHVASKDGIGLHLPDAAEVCAAYGISPLIIRDAVDWPNLGALWENKNPVAIIVNVPPSARISPKLGKSKDLLVLEK